MSAGVALAAPAVAADAATTAGGAGCFHCGQPLPARPPRVRVDGIWRAFCCDGCAAAAQWIDDARLDDYYRLRSEHAGRIDADAPDLAPWDREDALAGHVRELGDGGCELTLLTDGMRCAACAWLIDRALSREPGVREVSANAVTGRIRIVWDPAVTRLSAPLARLQALGYRPYLATGLANEQARRGERNRWLLRMGVAGLGAMQAMMFAEALYLDFDGSIAAPTRDFLRWITLLVSTPVVFYSGWPFLAGAARELRERRLGMDTLVASSVLLAYVASVVETIRGGAHVWFDAAVMFVMLLLGARLLEQRVRQSASAQVDALARARPAFAVREDAEGRRQSVPLAALAVGDVLCVASGEVVAADGVLLDRAASFEEALLTGESRPVMRSPGAQVLAGSVCREQPARIRVWAVGAHTRLSQLAVLVERAQAHRPALAIHADRLAGRFVLGLLLIAALTFAWWWRHHSERAFDVTLALLVISCPCALSLAVPAALAAANGALARLGVLPVSADALTRLARVSDLVFDKTGTLSDGRPLLSQVQMLGNWPQEGALRVAAALERDSAHPIASAFTSVDALPEVGAAETITGQGVQGWIDGRHWRLGQAGFAAGREDDGALWLACDRHAVARFILAEAARPDAAAAVDALRAQGVRLHLSSGDAAAAVRGFAERVGIDADAVGARRTPEAKLAHLRELQRQGRVVAMVGDGVNDAPVLAGADVSIAIGGGAALAQRAADLVLTGESLLRLPQALALARRTRTVIRQNFAWAVGYNLFAIGLAVTGLVTPWVAALGMALSSLAVTLNALRLGRRERR